MRDVKNALSIGPANVWRLRSTERLVSADDDGWLIGSRPSVAIAERTDDANLVTYFGAEVAECLLRPWTVRTMGSEPEEVHIGNFAPLMKKRRTPVRRIRGGMECFLRAVSTHSDIRRGHLVKRVLLARGKVVGVEGHTEAGGAFSERAELVVLALPAYDA